MRDFLKKIFVFLSMILAVFGTFGVINLVNVPEEAHAREVCGLRPDDPCDDDDDADDSSNPDATNTTTTTSSAPTGPNCRYFLGMVSWDCGTTSMNSESTLVANIAKIADNILTDVTVIAAYLVLGYVIYGGYLYMFSAGDPGKAAAGKKTITQAFIGLGITMGAYIIFSGIRIALIGNTSLGNCALTQCVTPDKMVTHAARWVVGIAGAVAAIFVVIGAAGYITASGDPGKLQKAKSTILYALIGLTIAALSEVLIAFVVGIIDGATSYLDTPPDSIANQLVIKDAPPDSIANQLVIKNIKS